MAETPRSADSLETMAFQVVLQKLLSLEQAFAKMERALQATPPLLNKIIAHLEAQKAEPEVPVATFDQVYAEFAEADDAEAPEEEPEEASALAEPDPGGASLRRRRFLRWFFREDAV